MMLFAQHDENRDVFSFFRIRTLYRANFGQATSSTFGHYKRAKTINIGFETEGDSYIQFRNPETNLPTEVMEVRINAAGPSGEQGVARITSNEKGRMSKIIFDELIAVNRFDAERLGFSYNKLGLLCL